EEAVFFDRMYKKQLVWTKSTRKYIYRLINLHRAKNILEVGSGTGALLSELKGVIDEAKLLGIDINPIAIDFCKRNNHSLLVQGDGNSLPFQDDVFDSILCNYLLLWIKNPFKLMQEFYRVTKPKGWIVVLAEPDYGGRIDHPFGEQWKDLILSSLSAYDPNIGRKLAQLFSQVGLSATVGLQSVVQTSNTAKKMYQDELDTISQFLPDKSVPLMHDLQLRVRKTPSAEMTSLMPVFYAYAQK
ncbi:MAG: methyltransferase domain-containing protein, partial [Candidatus Hodarchaeales archaeon]